MAMEVDLSETTSRRQEDYSTVVPISTRAGRSCTPNRNALALHGQEAGEVPVEVLEMPAMFADAVGVREAGYATGCGASLGCP